jgi:hypothetical protein
MKCGATVFRKKSIVLEAETKMKTKDKTKTITRQCEARQDNQGKVKDKARQDMTSRGKIMWDNITQDKEGGETSSKENCQRKDKHNTMTTTPDTKNKSDKDKTR